MQNVLNEEIEENILLKEKDFIRIFPSPKFVERRQIQISGEVNFPGIYFINQNYTLKTLFNEILHFLDLFFFMCKKRNNLLSYVLNICFTKIV